MKIPRKICWILTLGHWWKHYPGEKVYIRCRLCGRRPKSMWKTLRKIRKSKKDWGFAWIEGICFSLPFERTKK